MARHEVIEHFVINLPENNDYEMCIRDRDKTEALFEAIQKQLQEHTTAELGLLRGDLSELHSDLNGQEVRLSTVVKSVRCV